MGLVAELELEGLTVDGAYWRIGELYWNVNTPRTLSLRVDGYASPDAFQAGKGAIASQIIEVELPLEDPTNDRTQLFNGVRTLAYNIIKTTPNFIGAIDA